MNARTLALLAGLVLAGCSSEPLGPSLSGKDLSWADHAGAKWRNANLSGADLTGSILWGADLSLADLANASLTNANLTGADLRGARNLAARQLGTAIWEPGSPPQVDATLQAVLTRPTTDAKFAGIDIDRPEPAGEWKKLFAALKSASARISIETVFPRITKEAQPASLEELLLRTAHATTMLLGDVQRGSEGSVVWTAKTPERGEEYTVELAVGDRSRTLHLLSDLADVDIVRTRNAVGVALRHFDADYVLLWRARGLWIGAKVVLMLDPEVRSHTGELLEALREGGVEVVDASAGESSIPAGSSVVVLLQPRQPLDAGRRGVLERFIAGGGNVLLSIGNAADAPTLQSYTELLRAWGFALGGQQLFSGVKDPMSGELTFGTDRSRIVVLEGGVNGETVVMRPFARGEQTIEIADARALRRDPATKGGWLLRTEPYAWEGVTLGDPKEENLSAYEVASWTETPSGGRVVVISGRMLDSRLMNVANSNRDVGVRLLEWLALR